MAAGCWDMDLLNEEIAGELNAGAFAREVFGDDVEFFGADEGGFEFEVEVGFDGRVVALDDRPSGFELALVIGDLTGSVDFLGSATIIIHETGMTSFYVGKQITGVGTRVSGVNEQPNVGGFRFAGGFVKPDGEPLGVAGGLIGSDGEGAKERETLHGGGGGKLLSGRQPMAKARMGTNQRRMGGISIRVTHSGRRETSQGGMQARMIQPID